MPVQLHGTLHALSGRLGELFFTTPFTASITCSVALISDGGLMHGAKGEANRLILSR
jgi:hypothetical protein